MSPSSRRGFLRELAGVTREVHSVGGAGREADAEAEAAFLGDPSAEVVELRAPGQLSDDELDRYSRQLVLPEWSEAAQLALRQASVLVVGAGALGSPVALYLAGAGVGRLGIVDHDVVERSDLHRQLLHLTPDVGGSKARSAAVKLGFQNPEVEVVAYPVAFEPDNAAGLLAGHDLVVDCSDSFATRRAVNAACCAAGLALVEAGVRGVSGLVMSIRPGETACYRCAFPGTEDAGSGEASCARAGVLGPAAGVVGSLQALEALKLLTGFAAPVTDAFVAVELGEPSLRRVAVRRRLGCPDCAEG